MSFLEKAFWEESLEDYSRPTMLARVPDNELGCVWAAVYCDHFCHQIIARAYTDTFLPAKQNPNIFIGIEEIHLTFHFKRLEIANIY